MTDIVERLRKDWPSDHIELEAADEIERLRNVIKELEATLRFYADPHTYTDANGDDVQVPDFYSECDFGMTARRALGMEK